MALASNFPLGMRVLAIDDDPATLKSLENLLTRCQYNVEVTTRPTMAMRMLRGNRDRQFHMIIMDVHMRGVDGFKFIKIVDNKFHIPVIIVSEDGSRETIAKAVAHGSCDYLLKPVRLLELRNIWTHVLRRKLVPQGRLVADDLSILQDERQHQHSDAPAPDDKQKHRLIPAAEHSGAKEAKRKRRLSWTEELHHKFLAAVYLLGLDKAVPKKILELMKVDNLTLDHVSSHLQKYKLYVKKLSAVTGHHALIAAESLSKGVSRTKLVLSLDSVHPKTHQSIEIAGNSQLDLLQGVSTSFEFLEQSQQQQQQQQQSTTLRDATSNHQTIGIAGDYLPSYRSSQQQRRRRQQHPMAIQDANDNDSFIGANDNHLSIETAGNFQLNWLQGLPTLSDHPSDITDNLPLEGGAQVANNSLLDPTEIFDDDTLNQLLQHDQTWPYGVAETEPPDTILSDLTSVLMTPLFGDSFVELLQPIICDDNGSSSTPQVNFSNHLMQSPQQEWHQTYDQNSLSS